METGGVSRNRKLLIGKLCWREWIEMLYQLWGGSFISSISKFLQPHLVVVYKFSIILRQSCYPIKSRTFIHSASGFGHFVCPSSQSRYTCFTHLQKAFCHKPSRTTKLQVRQVLLNILVWNTWKTDKLIEKCACGSAAPSSECLYLV